MSSTIVHAVVQIRNSSVVCLFIYIFKIINNLININNNTNDNEYNVDTYPFHGAFFFCILVCASVPSRSDAFYSVSIHIGNERRILIYVFPLTFRYTYTRRFLQLTKSFVRRYGSVLSGMEDAIARESLPLG